MSSQIKIFDTTKLEEFMPFLLKRKSMFMGPSISDFTSFMCGYFVGQKDHNYSLWCEFHQWCSRKYRTKIHATGWPGMFERIVDKQIKGKRIANKKRIEMYFKLIEEAWSRFSQERFPQEPVVIESQKQELY